MNRRTDPQRRRQLWLLNKLTERVDLPSSQPQPPSLLPDVQIPLRNIASSFGPPGMRPGRTNQLQMQSSLGSGPLGSYSDWSGSNRRPDDSARVHSGLLPLPATPSVDSRYPRNPGWQMSNRPSPRGNLPPNNRPFQPQLPCRPYHVPLSIQTSGNDNYNRPLHRSHTVPAPWAQSNVEPVAKLSNMAVWNQSPFNLNLPTRDVGISAAASNRNQFSSFNSGFTSDLQSNTRQLDYDPDPQSRRQTSEYGPGGKRQWRDEERRRTRGRSPIRVSEARRRDEFHDRRQRPFPNERPSFTSRRNEYVGPDVRRSRQDEDDFQRSLEEYKKMKNKLEKNPDQVDRDRRRRSDRSSRGESTHSTASGESKSQRQKSLGDVSQPPPPLSAKPSDDDNDKIMVDLSRPPPLRHVSINLTVPPPTVGKPDETSFLSDERRQKLEEKTTWNNQTNDDSVNTDLIFTPPSSFEPEILAHPNKQDEVGIPPDNTKEEILKNPEPASEIRIGSSGTNQSDLSSKISDAKTKDLDTESKSQSNEEKTALPGRSDEIALVGEIVEDVRKTSVTNLPNQDLSNESELSGFEPQMQSTKETANQHASNAGETSSDLIIQHPVEQGVPLDEGQVLDLCRDLSSSSTVEPELEQPKELEDGELTDESDDSEEDRLFIDDTKESIAREKSGAVKQSGDRKTPRKTNSIVLKPYRPTLEQPTILRKFSSSKERRTSEKYSLKRVASVEKSRHKSPVKKSRSHRSPERKLRHKSPDQRLRHKSSDRRMRHSSSDQKWGIKSPVKTGSNDPKLRHKSSVESQVYKSPVQKMRHNSSDEKLRQKSPPPVQNLRPISPDKILYDNSPEKSSNPMHCTISSPSQFVHIQPKYLMWQTPPETEIKSPDKNEPEEESLVDILGSIQLRHFTYESPPSQTNTVTEASSTLTSTVELLSHSDVIKGSRNPQKVNLVQYLQSAKKIKPNSYFGGKQDLNFARYSNTGNSNSMSSNKNRFTSTTISSDISVLELSKKLEQERRRLQSGVVRGCHADFQRELLNDFEEELFR